MSDISNNLVSGLRYRQKFELQNLSEKSTKLMLYESKKPTPIGVGFLNVTTIVASSNFMEENLREVEVVFS